MKWSLSGGSKQILAILGLIFLGLGAVFLSKATQSGSSAKFEPDQVRITRDVEYGQVDGSSLLLDVYEPKVRAKSPRPALLMIHGGGWIEGDKASERDLATFLVPQGYVAFAVNYRLATAGHPRYPDAVLDVRRAVRWVRANAKKYGVDPSRLGAAGWSAGGQLVGLLGTTDLPDPADPNSPRESSRVACVVDTAGPTDFTDDANPPVGPMIARVIPLFFGKSREEIPESYRAASPSLRVDSKSAPTLIFHGTVDDIVPIEQSRKFDRALKAQGVEAKLIEMANEGHGFAQPENHQRWIDEITAFLFDHLKP